MILIPLFLIESATKDQPEGVYKDILSYGEISDDQQHLQISDKNIKTLKEKYPNIGRKKTNNVNAEEQPPTNTLTFVDKTSNFVGALKSWSSSGFETTNKDILTKRLEICKSCDFWDGNGFAGTGSCTKCGCSTQAKLRMATEKCPIGKW